MEDEARGALGRCRRSAELQLCPVGFVGPHRAGSLRSGTRPPSLTLHNDKLMGRGKRLRKLLKGLGLGLAGLLAAGVLLPVWFPWVLRPFAQRQGVHYARY